MGVQIKNYHSLLQGLFFLMNSLGFQLLNDFFRFNCRFFFGLDQQLRRFRHSLSWFLFDYGLLFSGYYRRLDFSDYFSILLYGYCLGK